MARVTLRIRRADVGPMFNVDAAIQRTEVILRDQRTARFRSQGASDGVPRWAPKRSDPSAQVLKSTGALERNVEFRVQKNGLSFKMEMTSARSMALISNVHQFGTRPGKDIVPIRARALFLPLTNLGRRSELIAGRRVGVRGDRRGRSRRNVPLKKGTDFIFRNRIPATPEKEGRAIQPRPHFRVTPKNRRELVNGILDSQIGA